MGEISSFGEASGGEGHTNSRNSVPCLPVWIKLPNYYYFTKYLLGELCMWGKREAYVCMDERYPLTLSGCKCFCLYVCMYVLRTVTTDIPYPVRIPYKVAQS